jgi:PAS domain S-box-containing protein
VAVYFAAAKLGLMLAFVHASATAVWPPTGIALASMLLLGPRVWPAILLGAFLANVTTAGNVWTSLGIATGNTLEGLLGAFLVTRFASGSDTFERARDILSFDILAGFLATTVSATIGVTSLALGSYASSHDFGAIWLTWWLGDVAGALVVAPVLILWGRRVPDLQRRDLMGLALLLAVLILTGAIVFGGLLAPWVSTQPLEFLCIPALMWAAFRYRQRGAATSLAVLAGIAVWGTLHGAGPFVRETQNESLLLLQAFMVTLALTILPLAAVVRERARAEEGLARLAAIVESSGDAIIGKTLDGTITTWNRGAERLYGYAAREVIGWPIALIIPRELDHELPMILERLERGERIDHRETVRVTREGRRVDVSITVSPTRDPYGRIAGASSIARDIGHRREMEVARRERDVLRSVAGLAAAVGHEINNPLAVVMGQAQLLARQVGGGERRRIDEMLDGVERIREILERMKNINKIVLLDGSETPPAMLDLTESSPPPTLDERA